METKEELWIGQQKFERRWNAITNIIFSFLFFGIAALICEVFGIGDWIRRNTVWFLLFAIGVAELDLTRTAEQFYRLTKGNTGEEEEDLMKQIHQLETNVNYIKNTVKELKERR